MKRFIIFIFLFFPIKLIAYYDFNCDDESIFFANNIKIKEIEISSFYCDFWKTKTFNFVENKGGKNWNFIKYDKKTKTISSITRNELVDYIRRLKIDLDDVKNDEETKKDIFNAYTKDYRHYKEKLPQFFKKYIFTKKQLLQIYIEIEKQPYRIFEKTFWERLLMNWKIISREEWWADENYSKSEIYMKWCEDWNCYTWPIAQNELKENYLNYFNEIDKKDKITKIFNDWRDSLNYFPVDRIIIHHTAGPYEGKKEDAVAYMKSVQKYHALTLRWWDVWYHYLIDWVWNIYEWHAWWKYVLWAHVATHNYWSIWIALMSDGYYSPEMLKSLQKLVIYLGKEYNLDLTQKTTVRNSNLTWREQWWVIIAHKELDYRKPKDPEIDMNDFRKEVIATKLKLNNTLVKK